MKKFKKLIPALCMLLISAVLMGTSTYAWFSMNKSVTATGMQVVAKSDATYLLIGSQNDASAIQTGNAKTIELTVNNNDAKVLPCAPALDATEVGYLTTNGKTTAGVAITTAGVKVENATTAGAFTNWYTANALTSDNAAIDTTTARQLTGFNGYVIQKTVYLTVAAGANAANNLKVSATIAQKGNGEDVSAAKVLVVTSNGGFAVLSSTNNSNVDIKGSNTNLTDTTVLTVNIYIYYDGNDTNVFTNNTADLTGATIDLTFDVDVVANA